MLALILSPSDTTIRGIHRPSSRTKYSNFSAEISIAANVLALAMGTADAAAIRSRTCRRIEAVFLILQLPVGLLISKVFIEACPPKGENLRVL